MATTPTLDDPVDVHVSTDDYGVSVVTLDRPSYRNAWNAQLERAYYAALDNLDRDSGVRAIVVTGSGRTFCPGADPAVLKQIVEGGLDLTGRLSPSTPLAGRKPLIAAINGACAGAGLVQALACDVRFAARGAKFSTSFVRRGLAGEHGVTWLLPRIIGHGPAMDLLVSGRVVSAEEAVALGMVSRILPAEDLLAAATEYARDVATNCSPIAMSLIRRQVWADQDASYGEALRRAFVSMQIAISAGDVREGLDGLLEKRASKFLSLDSDFDPGLALTQPVAFARQELARHGFVDPLDPHPGALS